MTFIKVVGHKCDFPDKEKFGLGTIWKCDVCSETYEFYAYRKNGEVIKDWFKIKSVETIKKHIRTSQYNREMSEEFGKDWQKKIWDN